MHTKILISFIALVLFFTFIVFAIFRNQNNFTVQTFDTVPITDPTTPISTHVQASTLTKTTPTKSSTSKTIQSVYLGGTRVNVDLATTQDEQSKGLSGRVGLQDHTGMLFVFERPDRYAFWMKDMKFAIDMIWISEDLHVVYIKKDAKPELYPETYGPSTNAKYVLEVASGFSDTYHIKEGDSVSFIY